MLLETEEYSVEDVAGVFLNLVFLCSKDRDGCKNLELVNILKQSTSEVANYERVR